jgi:hypothetical protein
MPIILRLDAGALEKLFPAGSEMRVELQNAVVAEFTRKHIKNVLDITIINPIVEDVKKKMQDQIDATCKDLVGTVSQWGNPKVRLNPELLTTLKLKVAEQVNAQVTEVTAQALVEGGPIMKMVEKRIQESLKYKITDEITRGVNAKLEAAKKAMEKA